MKTIEFKKHEVSLPKFISEINEALPVLDRDNFFVKIESNRIIIYEKNEQIITTSIVKKERPLSVIL